jgi:hypothetical protein
MRTAAQLRMLIANDRQRVASFKALLEDFYVDGVPQNFHAKCILARQVLRSHQEELDALLSPAAAAAQIKSGLADPILATSGAAQPAITF